jgi:hypothetical protein
MKTAMMIPTALPDAERPFLLGAAGLRGPENIEDLIYGMRNRANLSERAGIRVHFSYWLESFVSKGGLR